MFTDPILKQLVKKYPAPNFIDKSEELFASLIESIISQQLSVKVADVIFGRFLKLFDSQTFPETEKIIAMDTEKLRAVGMSYAKVRYVKAISEAFANNKIDTISLKAMTDEEVIIELTKLKGVGRWTAEMVLIFTLNRPDVFSIGDLGLRRAIEKLYGISDMKEILKLSETWKPYRSTASWYLWRSLENVPLTSK
jgi:DNA-3-methyladenine glycosylase II